MSDQLQYILNQLSHHRNDVNSVKDHNIILQNTMIGLGRVLKIPPEEFAEAMIGGSRNAEYEKDVLIAFSKITGRKINKIDRTISQEIKKDIKKSK